MFECGWIISSFVIVGAVSALYASIRGVYLIVKWIDDLDVSKCQSKDNRKEIARINNQLHGGHWSGVPNCILDRLAKLEKESKVIKQKKKKK